MKNAYLFKINFIGGIVSPGLLMLIMEALIKTGIEFVRLGLRQELLIDVPHKQYNKLKETFKQKGVIFEENTKGFPNITSSFVADEIFILDSWLKEGIYKDIFDLLDHRPKLKLNISDNNQCFTPFFTSNINWVASTSTHFWHLFIRFPKTDCLFQWPELLYTNELPRLSKIIEETIFNNKPDFYANPLVDGMALYQKICSVSSFISKPIEIPLGLPVFNLPYYEGMNTYGHKTWLGIYRRDEIFPVRFVRDMSALCLRTKIGQLYTTTWKSFVIKNIERQDRALWNNLLGFYRINVRHAANELAWQVEDDNEEGLSLKRHIIREFDKQDVRTFGLCFAIKINPESNMFGSIVIKKRFAQVRNIARGLKKYDLLHTPNFNPNSKEYILFRSDIDKKDISTFLISLTKHFYETRSQALHPAPEGYQGQSSISGAVKEEKWVFQCRKCLTVYDETMGDPDWGIAAGTSFGNLPHDYKCSLCEAPNEEFVRVLQSSLGI